MANQSQTSKFDSNSSRQGSLKAKPLNLSAARKVQDDLLNKSTRSAALSESPPKTGRSEKSAGSKSPKKTGKKKKKRSEDLELIDLFPEMDQMEKYCKKRLINT